MDSLHILCIGSIKKATKPILILEYSLYSIEEALMYKQSTQFRQILDGYISRERREEEKNNFG